MRPIFRFVYISLLVTGPLHNCKSLFDFGFEFEEIFAIENRLPCYHLYGESPTPRISDTRRDADAVMDFRLRISCQIRIKIRKGINTCIRDRCRTDLYKKSKNRSYCHVPLKSVSISVKKELLPRNLITIFLVSRMSVNLYNLLFYVLFCYITAH
jgi:hypothetical protein